MQRLIDIKKIVPSPFQIRKFSDKDKLKELAASIQRDGLIESIVVRLNGGNYENIAGGRRLEAIREYTNIKAIPAQIVKADDLQARLISAAENFQRENLSVIETIEAVVEIVDAQLIEDKQYASMGKTPADRVGKLLGKLHSAKISQIRGSKMTKEVELLFNTFVKQVEKSFKKRNISKSPGKNEKKGDKRNSRCYKHNA